MKKAFNENVSNSIGKKRTKILDCHNSSLALKNLHNLDTVHRNSTACDDYVIKYDQCNANSKVMDLSRNFQTKRFCLDWNNNEFSNTESNKNIDDSELNRRPFKSKVNFLLCI